MRGENCTSNTGGRAEGEVWHEECVWCRLDAAYGRMCPIDGPELDYERRRG